MIPKTSAAEYFSARLNPKTSKHDAKALEIIHLLEQQGYNFKQIAVDAILRAGGVTPSMFTKDSEVVQATSAIKDMLTEFLSHLKQNGLTVAKVDSANPSTVEDEKLDVFSDNFAKTFMQRSENIVIDDDDL